MSVTTPTRAGQAELEAAQLLLERMGITPDQLLQAAKPRRAAPTFAEYIPVVEAAVGPGTRRVYGTYWNRLRDRWGQRAVDEPTPSQIKQLCEDVRANVVVRRNARGGHKAVVSRPGHPRTPDATGRRHHPAPRTAALPARRTNRAHTAARR